MNKPTKQQMGWFVTKLIDIREDTKRTPNHIADIEFDCKEIAKQKSIFPTTDEATPKEKIISMLDLIKNDNVFLAGFHNFNGDLLSWTPSDDGIFQIKGYQTKLLKAYRQENIFDGERVFGLTKNDEGQQVISLYGESTDQPVESEDQYRAFCYLLSNPGRIVTYLELFDEITKSRLHSPNYYPELYTNDTQKKMLVKTTVYNLKRKLYAIGKKYDIDIDSVLETMSKKGYRYHK